MNGHCESYILICHLHDKWIFVLKEKKTRICFVGFHSDDDYLEQKQDGENSNQRAQAASLLDTPQNVAAIEHKKGYMMRKCCYESNYKKSKLKSISNNEFGYTVNVTFALPF